ncbi:MAG: hypothetical protein KJ559_02255 [Nanoarchaeota archaeon]|nr:hypothetical protein [Nanoarchaeota archaeon]
MKSKNNNIILVILALVIIGFILTINSLNNNENYNIETIKCIGENSKLFVSKTCGHCAKQKMILEGYEEYFEIIDCFSETELCMENNIQAVPTWIINNQEYTGVKTFSELKEFSGC